MNGTILVVDDDPISLSTMANSLIQAGHDVSISSNALDALTKINQKHFDLVFTELLLKETSSIDLCKALKKFNAKTVIILVTTAANPNAVYKNIKSFVAAGGRDEYLRKPLFAEDLPEIANKILNEIYDQRL